MTAFYLLILILCKHYALEYIPNTILFLSERVWIQYICSILNNIRYIYTNIFYNHVIFIWEIEFLLALQFSKNFFYINKVKRILFFTILVKNKVIK